MNALFFSGAGLEVVSPHNKKKGGRRMYVLTVFWGDGESPILEARTEKRHLVRAAKELLEANQYAVSVVKETKPVEVKFK